MTDAIGTDEERELIERLTRKFQRLPATGGGSIGIGADGKTTSTSYLTDDGYRHVNPDGPAAADALQSRIAEVARLEEALREIREAVTKRQLPITNQVFEIADAALGLPGSITEVSQ